MTLTKINDRISIGCESFSNSRNWGHRAICFVDGQDVSETKVFYQNRTWEAYQFDTVKRVLLSKLDKEKVLSLADRRAIALSINLQ